MPSLSVRAFSELLAMPMYEQGRILHEQKYPKQGNAQFKVPYYNAALKAIRRFYRGSSDPQILLNHIDIIHSGPGLPSKKDNNIRAISSILKSDQIQRKFTVSPIYRLDADMHGVQVRLAFDIETTGTDGEKKIFYNFRAAPLEPEIARMTLDLSKWILEQSGKTVSMSSLEYVDLCTGKVYRFSKRRNRTIQIADHTAGLIQTLWPSI